MKRIIALLVVVAACAASTRTSNAAIDTNRAARLAAEAAKNAEYLQSLLDKAVAEAEAKRPARPPKPYDLVAAAAERHLKTKMRLAPWLFADGKPTAAGKAFLENTNARQKGLRITFSSVIQPKIDLRSSLKRSSTQKSAMKTFPGGGGAFGPESLQPRLEIVDWVYDAQFNRTIFELWLVDAPLDEWWDIFRAPTISSPSAWVPSRVGPPDGVSGNIQQFFVVAPGQPQQTFFQIFLHQDSDYDGIPDGYEVALFKTDPLNPDTDGNGIADGDEDADQDGLSNSYELSLGTNPLIAQSNTDSDGDGLPDWMELLIAAYTGDVNASPTGDSDGDGVDNWTEFTTGTDPSWAYDAAYADFSGLPDEQRVIIPESFEFTQPAPSSPPGSITSDDEAYLHFTFAGVDGTTANFQVIKNMNAAGETTPGTDLMHWSIGFGQYIYGNLPVLEPDNEDLTFLENIVLVSTSTAAEIWEKAKISENLHQLTRNSLVYLQYRSVQRIVVQMRVLQLIQTQTPLPQGVLLRTRKALAVIHTEATVFRAATFEIGNRFPGHEAFAKSGALVHGAGRFAQCLSIYNDARQTWPYLEQYLYDVMHQCDSGASSDLLGYALSILADDFQAGFVLFPSPYIFGDILCTVNPGCDATCN